MRPNKITRYWLEHYATMHCTLCGNSGIIDSRGARTAAGLEVGRLNYCICPNGQQMRKQGWPLTQGRNAYRA